MGNETIEDYLQKYRNKEEYQDEGSNENDNVVDNTVGDQERNSSIREKYNLRENRQSSYKLSPKQVDKKVNSLNRKVNFSSLEGVDKVKYGVKYLLNRGMDVLDNLDIAEEQKEKLEEITEKVYNHLDDLSQNRQYLRELSNNCIADASKYQGEFLEASELTDKYAQEMEEHKQMLNSVQKYSPEFFEAHQNYQKAKDLYFDSLKDKATSHARRKSCERSRVKVEHMSNLNHSVEFDLATQVLVNNEELQHEAGVYHNIMRTIMSAVKDTASVEEYHSKVEKCLTHYDSFSQELKGEYVKRISPKMKFKG